MRWWKRNPPLGVFVALVGATAALGLLLALGRPVPGGHATFVYMTTLPIALLLPAICVAGAFLAWQAAKGASLRMRWWLLAAAILAVIANIAAVGLFMRFLIHVIVR